jgi:hypothetical protein
MNNKILKNFFYSLLFNNFTINYSLIKKSNERLKKIADENPDKITQYRRTAYLNRKNKLKNIENNIQTFSNS